MRPVRLTRDPAPSRLAYRINRLMLTPRFRAFLRYGVPGLMLTGVVLGIALDPDRREEAEGYARSLWAQVEDRPEFVVGLTAIEGVSGEVGDQIREVLPVNLPTSSFRIDLEDVRAAVLTVPAVAEADVSIRSGGVLTINVVERVPVALWRTAEGLALVDLDGRPIGPATGRGDWPDLPVLAGAGAEKMVGEALALVQAAAPIQDRLRGLERVGERRWNLALDRGQEIMLPEKDARRALMRVLALDGAQDLLARDLTRVDMRNPDQPIIRLSEGAAGALRTMRMIETGAEAK